MSSNNVCRVFLKIKPLNLLLKPACSSSLLPTSRSFCSPSERERKQGDDDPNNEFDPYYKWRTPWRKRPENFQSKFAVFNPSGGSADFMRIMQQDIDLRPSTIKKWWKRVKEDSDKTNQRFIEERHMILGPDLATAHFVVHRGGAVRFRNSREWVRADEDEEYNLPSHEVEDMYVEDVDLSTFRLYYPGLENLVRLRHLRSINFSGQPDLDDWWMDRLTNVLADSLKLHTLDLSLCPKLTHRGVSILYRLPSLRVLHLEGVEASPELGLTCFMLQDLNPQLVVHGVEQLDPPESAPSTDLPST